ncbi:hypothetical protein GCM10017783_16640 [Deinococcus piscis]|uniref:Uncharacterized protein n=1 Tax=Deinococcus piscis TaxID=394230 RepID=A0ABQ3K9D1_9DEIO|nr:hypothetical protein [Deinococcus piscis]GHG04673.1 hypothetical protein GCM10017783_16640 [Deinococcus piscis]
MKALTIMADSLRAGYIHPTRVLNTLIELENAGGIPALREFESQLRGAQQTLTEGGHPHARLAEAWLQATRFYLQEYQQGAA